VDFGAGPVAPIGTVDLALAKLSASGTAVFGQRFSGAAFDGEAKIAVSTNGTVYAGGTFVGAIDFGAGALSAGAGNSYLVKLSAGGLVQGQHQFTATQSFELGATPDEDALVVAVLFNAPPPGAMIDFGTGSVFTHGGYGMALAKLRL
jgi:hypothetical protein